MPRPLLLPSLLLTFSAMVTAKLSPEQLHVDVVTTGDCSQVAGEDSFVTIHFRSFFDDGTAISSTYDRGVPVEIQLGTKMLSPGLDEGLRGMCVHEKRTITLSSDVGLIDIPTAEPDDRKVVYDVTLVSMSNRTTVNTFNYLDLNGDKRISAEEAESLVKMFMKALSTDIGVDVQTLVSFFITLHDKDGDGLISDSEFLDSVEANEKVLNAFAGKDEL